MSKANYIICVHKDLDGICCAAIILQHYPDAKVFFSPQGSVQNIFYRLKSYLRNYVQNNFFICDISSDSSSVKHIKKIMNKYVKEFDLHVIWIDHHDWDKSDKISDDIEVMLEPTSKSAAKLVQQYFNSNSDSVYVKIAEGEFVRYKFYWTTVIQNVCKKLYYDENLGYVLKAFSQFEPNEKTDEFYIVPQELSEEELDSIPVFETNYGHKFAILEMENIEHEIKWQKEAYRIMKHHRCDFICVIFENGRYSFRSRIKGDLKFLKEHGAVGHLKDNSLHIKMPYIKWRDTDFHRPISKEEFIEVLKGNKKIYETNNKNPPLNQQKIDYITQLRQLPSMTEEIFNKLCTREITDVKKLIMCDNKKLKKFGIPYKFSIPLKEEALE
ncbi:MAG: DHH family phosphoesterase, partial [Candidatus Hodarchaeota archaeon]